MQKKEKTTIIGIHPILESINAGISINKIFLQRHFRHPLKNKLLQIAMQQSIPVSRVPLVKLNKLSSRPHQGAIALTAAIPFCSLESLLPTLYESGETPLLILLDGVLDVGNVGAIARSALAAGAHALIVPMDRMAPINSVAMKASAGALAHLPVCRVGNLQNTLIYLLSSGLQIVACSEKGRDSYLQGEYRNPTALLFGGEGKGIATANLVHAQSHLSIPMAGPVSSLNVSVAAALFLFEVKKQRAGSISVDAVQSINDK